MSTRVRSASANLLRAKTEVAAAARSVARRDTPQTRERLARALADRDRRQADLADAEAEEAGA